MTMTDKYRPHKKAVWVVVAVILTASVSGFFMGLRQTNTGLRAATYEERHEPASFFDGSNTVPRVVEYKRLGVVDYKANGEWMNALEKLKQETPDLFSIAKGDPAQRAEAIDARKARRAYDGAPPTVPHPVDQLSPANCIACHGEGKRIRGAVASKMSHPFMQNCTQCHVPSGGTDITAEDILSEPLAMNDFAGFVSPGNGKRAYEGAPPTIPHPTSMRSDCMSCHGPNGVAGLRTSHPYRQSCTQCHAPSAEMDQRLFEAIDFPGKAPERLGP
jgi:cytochrome c-type protein NapB